MSTFGSFWSYGREVGWRESTRFHALAFWCECVGHRWEYTGLDFDHGPGLVEHQEWWECARCGDYSSTDPLVTVGVVA